MIKIISNNFPIDASEVRLVGHGCLKTLIKECGNNLIRCFETLNLSLFVQPPLAEPSIENIVKFVKFVPDSTDINPHVLHAEFSNFVAHIDLLNNTFDNMEQIGEFSEITNRCFRLLLTIPVTVATKDKRTFSRLKTVKHHFETQWAIKGSSTCYSFPANKISLTRLTLMLQPRTGQILR